MLVGVRSFKFAYINVYSCLLSSFVCAFVYYSLNHQSKKKKTKKYLIHFYLKLFIATRNYSYTKDNIIK